MTGRSKHIDRAETERARAWQHNPLYCLHPNNSAASALLTARLPTSDPVEEFALRANNREEAEALPPAGRGCDSEGHRSGSTPGAHRYHCLARSGNSVFAMVQAAHSPITDPMESVEACSRLPQNSGT